MADPDDTVSPPPHRSAHRQRAAAGNAARVRQPGRLAAGLALVFATIALLASGYMGYLINSKRGLSDAKGRLVQVEQDTAELEQQTSGLRNEVRTLRDTQATLVDGLMAMQRDIGKGRRAWLLDETENLLIIAQNRLVYSRDARLARLALQAADLQLAQLGDPDYQPVRKSIAAGVAALEAFERLDLSGHAQRLGHLAGRVDQLATLPDTQAASARARTDQGFLHDFWGDLKELIRVRSTADVPRPFLLPEQRYFVRENLRLMLYGAQIALLHGDGTTFEQNTRAAQKWLQTYFDTHDTTVQTALAELNQALQARSVNLPELGNTLALLHDVRQRQTGS